jgi:IS30 family transposase
VKREGTLMGTTAVARLLGTDLTTVERKIRRGELVPTDYVDNRAAVFSREEILRHVEHLGRHSHVEGQRVEDIEIKQASEVRDT